MKLSDLFEVKNGIPTSGLRLSTKPKLGHIPMLRPSSSQYKLIAGWVDVQFLADKSIYPANSLIVSTNGEGSHTYSYVYPAEFCCNSDVSVLDPRSEMSIEKKVFYARCITMNRFLFSYGRKPKGARLKLIELPDFPAEWEQSLPSLEWSAISDAANSPSTSSIPEHLEPQP